MKLRDKLNAIDDKIAALKAKRKAIIVDAQSKCEHPEGEIFEAPMKSNVYTNAWPPFRVCRACGYAEEGWHCGYFKLAFQNAFGCTREEGDQMTLTFHDNQKVADMMIAARQDSRKRA